MDIQSVWDNQNEQVMWTPSETYMQRSRLLRFMNKHAISSYQKLCEHAADDPSWFWDAVSQDLELYWSKPYTRVMDIRAGIPWARWFVDGKLNYAYNALDKHIAKAQETGKPELANHTALIWEGEDASVKTYSYVELNQLTNQTANALQSLGVARGDRVGVFLPMIPETVAAVLACGKLGAIYIPIFSGYGPEAVATRLRDSGAKVLVTADGFFRRGKLVPMYETAAEALRLTPDVQHMLIAQRAQRTLPVEQPRDVLWNDLTPHQSDVFTAVETDAEEPFMIIYTSGTTGKPKGAVHTHDGFPIKAAQDMAHIFDVQPDDVFSWITDIGWMMGPWAICGTLMLGATLVIYDGAMDYPQPDRLWSFAERHKITMLGVSPTAIRSLMSHGYEIVEKHDLSALRAFGSTGEPWNIDPWKWLFEHAGKSRIPIINYSGGTEISGGIVGCPTILPLKPCSFSGPIPGVPADVVDETGVSVHGAVGELVIRGPWPGMTRGFWNDNARYEDTYWSRFPGLWTHGDFAAVDADGFWYILGRSDDTIKVAGKRLGPAEAESAAVSHFAVAEAAAIGAPHAVKGETLVVFVTLRPNHSPSDALAEEIRAAVAGALGPALKPERVIFISQLPRTRNGKILRRLIRQSYTGQQLGDLTAIENPETLQEIAAAGSRRAE